AAAQVRHFHLERQRRASCRHRLDVTADAERAACTLEQHRAYLGIVSRAPRRLDEACDHLGIERILPIRTVHRDGEQTVFELLQDHVVHGASSLLFCRAITTLVIASEAKQSRNVSTEATWIASSLRSSQ